jgi:Bacterial Ig domain
MLVLAAFVIQFVAPSRAAAAEPVLRTPEAQAAWGYLEHEAETLLSSQGLSSEMSETQARGLIRSYIFLRLIGIINHPSANDQADQAALSYLQSLVITEQHYSAVNAGQTWDIWAGDQLECPNGNLDWLVWEGGNAACGFWQLFGEHPNESAFTTAGFNNLWSSFSSNEQASDALSDMITGTTYWGGAVTDLPPSLTGEALSAADVIHGVLEHEFGLAAKELLAALASSAVDAIKEGEVGPEDLIPLGIAAGVIAADASWNAYDVSNIAEGLTKEESATEPANNPTPDLSLLTQQPGIAELAYVVASQTLDGLATEESPCSYDTSAGIDCYTYSFDADPDFQQAIYGEEGSTTTPPVAPPVPNESAKELDTDPFFELTELGKPGATCDSPTVEPPVSCGTASSSGQGASPMWRTSLPAGGGTTPVNADVTSARGVDPAGEYDGYTSFIHNGMFVTRTVNVSGGALPNSWLYRPSMNYEAPDGTRWTAWYQDGSFLQTKVAAPFAGSVWTGYRASDIYGTECEEEPTWFPDLYEATPTGELCLLESTGNTTGGQVTIQALQPGDELMVLGARAVVKEVVGCYENNFFKHFRCSGNPDAAVLDPGQAQIGSAFSWQNAVADITGLSELNDPFTFSPQDPRAWVLPPLDTCAGRTGSSCQPPSSDIANCNLPVLENSAEPWSSTGCFRSSTITYTLENNSVWRAQLVTPPVAVSHQYTADADNSAFPCCTSTKLVVPAAEGVLAGATGTDVSTAPPSNISASVVQQPADGTVTLKKDGSFEYTPNSGFGWNGPAEDTFTYQVCNTHLPTWEKKCSEASVTLTVRQAPPTANPVTIASNTGSPEPGSYLYISSYKYSDRQGTAEGPTSFEWYRNGQATHITAAEYQVGQGDAGSTITAVVTPTAQDGTQGVPAGSNPEPISPIGRNGPFSYVAYPTSDTLTCAPTPIYYPATPPMSTTCTATVTVKSLTAYIQGAAKPEGKVSFRSTVPGAFGASSSCSLAYRGFDAATSTTTASCSVSFSPGGSGSAGVVGVFSYSLPPKGPAGKPGAPGGFGHIVDYQTANVPVEPSGPGGVVRFKVTGLSNAPAATPQSVTVTAIDGYGKTTPGYTGTIHFTSTDPNAILPADYTFTSADQGTHTFTGVTLNTAIVKGTTLTATDTALPAIMGSQTATISVGPAARLLISGFKYDAEGQVTAGTHQKVTVTAEDAGGNVVTGYAGTVRFSSSDAQATLPADYTFTSTDQGKHAFASSELVLRTSSNATVTVSDGTISGSATSPNCSCVPVGPAATSQFKIELENPLQPVTAGEPRTIVVTAMDAYGNVTPFYTGAVSFSSSDNAAVLPSPYTFTDSGDNGDYGRHEFSDVVLRSVGHGSQTIKVADTAHSNVKGTISLPVLPGPTASLLVSIREASGGDPIESPQNLTVTAVDAFGNITPSYRGTVTFSSTDRGATLPQNYTFTSADEGVHEFSRGVTLKTAGSQTITATDLAFSAITGSQTIAVRPGPAVRLYVSGLLSAPPGATQTVTVTAADAANNVATGYTGTIAFTSTDRAAGLPADYTFTSSDAGVHTFTNGVTLNTVGAQKVTVTDTAHRSISGVENVDVASSRFSASSGTLIEGQPGSVATRDYDASDTISESGALPPGVSFAASIPGDGSSGEGEGVFSGTPEPGSAGTYPVTLTVHDFSDPPAEYSQTFTLTVLAPTPGVSLRSSSSSLDATEVLDQVGFTPARAVAEGGSISVTAPAGVMFSGLKGFGGVLDDTVNVYVAGRFVGIESPTVSSSAGVQTLKVPVEQFSVGAGEQVYLDIAPVDNPTVASSGSWTVATSSDATPVAVGQESFAQENAVAPFGASASPATAGATEVWYEETFVAADELRATDYQNTSLFQTPGGADSSITFTAPVGASFPEGCPRGYLTDATHLGDSQQLVCQYGPPSGNKLTYYVEDANVPAGDDVTVFVEGDGATNPSSPGPNQISLTTSSDPDPIAVPIDITAP